MARPTTTSDTPPAPQTPRQTFQRYLAEQGLSRAEFIARFGKDASAISHALRTGPVSFYTERLRLQIERLAGRAFWHPAKLSREIAAASEALGIDLATAPLAEIRDAMAMHSRGSATIDPATDGLTHFAAVLQFFFPKSKASFAAYLRGQTSGNDTAHPEPHRGPRSAGGTARRHA